MPPPSFRTQLDVKAGAAACAIDTSDCKIIGHFSMQNHHFSGVILHFFCIFNRKFKTFLAFILQFATARSSRFLSTSSIPCSLTIRPLRSIASADRIVSLYMTQYNRDNNYPSAKPSPFKDSGAK